jgi:type I restriction enzyme S subunit
MKEEARPALLPKLRFLEFRNKAGWSAKKLNNLLFETKTRNRSLAFGPAEVLSVSGEHGCVNQIEYMGRSYAGVTVKDYHIVEHGDVVYTKSPLKRNPFGIIKENKGKRGIVSTLYAVYRPFPDCSASYLDHFFSGDYNLNAYLQPIVKKGAKNDMKVNNADALKGDICVPNLLEQQKIAECLSSVDALMAAQARKVDALKTYKKGLIQQLFPRAGETQPRLRIPEFQNADEWEEKVGGELFTNRKEKGEQGLPIYSVTVNDGMVPRASFERNFYDIEDPAGNRKVHKGDIAYNMMRMWQGAQGVAPEDCMVSPAYVVLKPSSSVCSDFFAYLFKLPQSLRLLTVTSRGLTKDRLRLYFDDFAKMPLCVPEIAEQERIATCLSRLDALIAVETQKLEAIKTHKKGLMQQLFPSPEEVEA